MNRQPVKGKRHFWFASVKGDHGEYTRMYHFDRGGWAWGGSWPVRREENKLVCFFRPGGGDRVVDMGLWHEEAKKLS